MKRSILIIDDDTEVRSMIADILSDEGYIVKQAENWMAAKSVLSSEIPDLIFLDLWIEENEYDGIVILEKIKKKYPTLPVIMISGHGNIEIAVKAIKNGAYDFIEKPFVIERMLITAERAIESSELKKENTNLKKKKPGSEAVLIGRSNSANQLRSIALKASNVNSMIFITGQLGCCADDLAWNIHYKSNRFNDKFLVVNCSSLSQQEIKDEIFGGAKNLGAISRAAGGTLLINDIFSLDLDNQAKLLRYLQTGVLNGKKIDTRIVSFSHESFSEYVKNSQFSGELYMRLSVINIDIKPIGENLSDIEDLINYFSGNSREIFGIDSVEFSEGAKVAMLSYPWPGNLKQLRNAIECAFIKSSGEQVELTDLPKDVYGLSSDISDSSRFNVSKYSTIPLREARDIFEREYISFQILRFAGNMTKVAHFIEMDRSALYKKIKHLGIDDADSICEKAQCT